MGDTPRRKKLKMRVKNLEAQLKRREQREAVNVKKKNASGPHSLKS